MADKKNSPALPQDIIGSVASRFVYCSVAGGCVGSIFRSPAGRWASLAFGAGVGVGSAYVECHGSLAKFANPKSSDIPASPNGED